MSEYKEGVAEKDLKEEIERLEQEKRYYQLKLEIAELKRKLAELQSKEVKQ